MHFQLTLQEQLGQAFFSANFTKLPRLVM